MNEGCTKASICLHRHLWDYFLLYSIRESHFFIQRGMITWDIIQLWLANRYVLNKKCLKKCLPCMKKQTVFQYCSSRERGRRNKCNKSFVMKRSFGSTHTVVLNYDEESQLICIQWACPYFERILLFYGALIKAHSVQNKWAGTRETLLECKYVCLGHPVS